MTTNGLYQPKPEHKFSFGLWTVGNRGRDPFGDFVRPVISPVDIVAMLGEGMTEHDFGDSAFQMLFLVLMTLPFAVTKLPSAGSGSLSDSGVAY